ncbi:MAG: GGDEF domain-containing protein, partial [Sphingomonas sp.]
VIFDLDHFKAINDRHGHAVGDTVIAAFAALLQRSAPQAAIVARIGGEEFAMLIERSTAETAWLNAEAIRVATAGLAAAGLPPVSVSGGVAARRDACRTGPSSGSCVLPSEEWGAGPHLPRAARWRGSGSCQCCVARAAAALAQRACFSMISGANIRP